MMGGMLRTLVLLLIAAGLIAASAASAAAPALYKNCTALNKKYPHGVGLANAKDKTSSTPVSTFKRSTPLYRTAMSHNKRLDGDKDGIACEKK
jgi:hypothetical protein